MEQIATEYIRHNFASKMQNHSSVCSLGGKKEKKCQHRENVLILLCDHLCEQSNPVTKPCINNHCCIISHRQLR